MRLGLGAAQFGLDYGISNRQGKLTPGQVSEILIHGASHGMDVLDTAAAYGTSEEVIGALNESTLFKIVSKVLNESEFEHSLQRLGRTQIYGVLIHHSTALLTPAGPVLFRSLEQQKARGRVQKIGVSIVNFDHLASLLERYSFDLVQLPMNVLDQRLLDSGQLQRLKERGIEVHIRSAFLQGALLLDPSELPDYFSPYRNIFLSFHAFGRKNGMTPLEAALGFFSCPELKPWIDVLLVGVTSVTELDEILRAYRSTAQLDSLWADYRQLGSDHEGLINPAKWPPRNEAKEQTQC